MNWLREIRINERAHMLTQTMSDIHARAHTQWDARVTALTAAGVCASEKPQPGEVLQKLMKMEDMSAMRRGGVWGIGKKMTWQQ